MGHQTSDSALLLIVIVHKYQQKSAPHPTYGLPYQIWQRSYAGTVDCRGTFTHSNLPPTSRADSASMGGIFGGIGHSVGQLYEIGHGYFVVIDAGGHLDARRKGNIGALRIRNLARDAACARLGP